MVREIKGFQLLEGYRGQEPADIAALEQLILKALRVHRAAPRNKGTRPEPRLRLQGRGAGRGRPYRPGLASSRQRADGSRDGHPRDRSQLRGHATQRLLDRRRTRLSNMAKRLERAFDPRTVAVVGDKRALGYFWLRNMSTFKREGVLRTDRPQ